MAIFRKKSEATIAANLELNPELPSVEKATSLEIKPERLTDRERESPMPEVGPMAPERGTLKTPAHLPANQPDTVAIGQMNERLQRIESVLEEDLGEIYSHLDSQHQQMFKRAGEATARQIEVLLKQAKVKVLKIFELIKSWLMMITGINKWFVIQESKIKTDKIIRLKDKS